MKKSILSLVLAASILSTACSNTSASSAVADSTADSTSTDVTTVTDTDSSSSSEGTWGRTFFLNGETYHIGDPISTLSWTKEEDGTYDYRSYIPVTYANDGNTYINISYLGSSYGSIYATNLQPHACLPEECVITAIQCFGEDAREILPDFTGLDTINDYFGEKYLVDSHHDDLENNEYFRYDYGDFRISVNVTEEKGLVYANFDYYNTLDEETYRELRKPVEHFDMGFSHVSLDDSNMTITDSFGYFVKDSDYADEVQCAIDFGDRKECWVEFEEATAKGNLKICEMKLEIPNDDYKYEYTFDQEQYHNLYIKYKDDIGIYLDGFYTEEEIDLFVSTLGNWVIVTK